MAVLGTVSGCGGHPSAASDTPISGTAQTLGAGGGDVPVGYSPKWEIGASRRETITLPLMLPSSFNGTVVTVGSPQGPDTWLGKNGFQLLQLRESKAPTRGPLVAQLTGMPQMETDQGSMLMPIEGRTVASVASNDRTPLWAPRAFRVDDARNVYVQVEVSSLQRPGAYEVPIVLQGKGEGAAAIQGVLRINVADLALPTSERVIGTVTTTFDRLQAMFPQSFIDVRAAVVDREAAGGTASAVAVLDALQSAAHVRGIAFFVEDLSPSIHIDDVGRVALDWNAYDRIVGPWMDGTGFEDRVPLGVWLAPLPPKRIADAPTQLMQYLDACAKHFSDKGWSATPAFLHPRLAEIGEGEGAEKLRDKISEMFKLHVQRDFLAVTVPGDEIGRAQVPQQRLWSVMDGGSNIPPTGILATQPSVSAWPWMCAARSAGSNNEAVRGFVWRDGIGSAGDAGAGIRALFAVTEQAGKREGDDEQASVMPSVSIVPTLRMAWLTAGMNGVRLLGLLEQRADERTVKEVLADVVARAGMSSPSKLSTMPTSDPEYVHTGWSSDPAMWSQLSEKLQTLVAMNVPGSMEGVGTSSPEAMAAKLWLAQGRRPSARVAGYQFGVESDLAERLIVRGTVHVLAENPVATRVAIDGSLGQLSGDWMQKGERTQHAEVAGLGVTRMVFPIEGHSESLAGLRRRGGVLQLRESDGGATLRLPVQLPVVAVGRVEGELVADGDDAEWSTAGRAVEMDVDQPFLNRPTYLAGDAKANASGDDHAHAKWLMDNDMLYVTIRCPQPTVSDDRTNDWPLRAKDWWGTDGVQVELAGISSHNGVAMSDIVRLGFKPSGAIVAMVGHTDGSQVAWREGAPSGSGVVRYGVRVERTDGKVTGWVVEAAIPRAWFKTGAELETASAWRVNILRHRAAEGASRSESWSGPLIDDEDVGMMGLMVAADASR